MIKLSHLNKSFYTQQGVVHALRDVSLSVNRGEVFGVIGTSGAGKSTLIRCVNLLEIPDSGQVIVNEQNMMTLPKKGLRDARHKIGMIFQHFNLLNSRTVYDNIALPLELLNVSKGKIKEKVSSLLELTGLVSKKDNYPSQLSGGQKQRVAIARALASDPLVLLSDEATSALDPQTTHAILELLKDVNRQLGVTILLITHEMQVIKQICDRVAVIEHGNIIEQASVLDFFNAPQSKAGKQFVASLPSHRLPELLAKTLKTEYVPNALPLLRISFMGEAAQKPLIAELSRTFSINVNILQATIEEIREKTIGIMVLEVQGTQEQLKSIVQFFHEHNVKAEVIGYVERMA